MSTFWSLYVIAIVVFNLVGCAVLLLANSRLSAEEARRDTTGHVFDGIEERNQPLPRWWLFLFVGTLLFSAAYLVLYPGLGNFAGTLGWTSEGQWQQEVDLATSESEPLFREYAKVPMEELVRYPEALAVGGRLFANHCAICHGSDARGARGYPNLTDTDWLYGGSPAAIKESIAKGRRGTMPPMMALIGNTDRDVRDMAIYVQSLSNPAMRDNTGYADAISRARPKFAMCAACHGNDATGNPLFGAPNLTDRIWLHSPRLADIETLIREGRNSHMPAHDHILSPEQIHVLASYVYSLSQPASPEE